MRRTVLVVLAALVALVTAACGGDDEAGGGDDDACAGCDGGAGAPDAGTGPERLVAAFAFDQQASRIVRYHDANRDGDAMDAGEVTIFFDNERGLGIYNALGIAVVGPDEIYATDNVAGDHNDDAGVVHLIDENGDGDALDPGEATLFWAGELPEGGGATLPIELDRAPDGSLRLVHNDAFDRTMDDLPVPDSIYRLADDNGDGDALDPGEVTVLFDLDAAFEPDPQFLSFAWDPAGVGYGIDIQAPVDDPNNASLHRFDPAGEITELADSADLVALTLGDPVVLPPTSDRIAYDRAREEILIETSRGYADPPTLIIGLRDVDGSGKIDDPAELRIRYDSAVADDEAVDLGYLKDFTWLPDGSLIGGDALHDKLFQLVDADRDGDFDDAGEIRVIYDAALAAAAGLPVSGDFLTVRVATEPVPDD